MARLVGLYPRAVQKEWLRALAVALFAVAAVLAGIGNERHERWLVALAFGCFAAGVLVVMRWRAANRAKVFAREEKTSEQPPRRG